MTRRARAAALYAAVALAALASAAPSAAQAPSFSWDAELATSASVAGRGGEAELRARDRLSLGLGLETESAKGTFSLEAGAVLVYAPQDVAAGASRSEALLLYPAALAAAWESAQRLASDSWFRFAVGRIEAREPSGLLLRDPRPLESAQVMDGATAELRLGRLYASLGGGYLGLLDKRQNLIRFGARDEADLADPDRYWAPPRTLAVLRIEAERLFLGQDAGILGVWQKDFREGQETYDDWYIGAVAKGPLVPRLRHEETAIVSIAVQSEGSARAGILARAELAYDPPLKPLGEARIAALWAGGWGGSFPSLAGPAASLLYDAPPEDLVAVELGADASLSPPPRGARLDTSLALRALFVPSGSVESGYSFGTEGRYLGVEVEAALGYEPISGFDIDARGGFLASPGAIHPCAALAGRIAL